MSHKAAYKDVLVVDDEEKLRSLLSRILSLEGYRIAQASSLSTAKAILQRQSTDVVICDVKLPDGNGVDFTSWIKTHFPKTEIILLTAFGNIPDGVQAMKNGAFDYITKGDDNNKIVPLLERAMEKVQLSRRVQFLEKQLEKKYSFDTILGSAPPIEAAKAAARKVAQTNATVLLTGETGTGKEVFAQAIHLSGSRAQQPFVAVNCSAFSKDLLENELFGHKAGAFTGAQKESRGLLEEADTGTIFLDEIGEMPLDLQAKLLRVLETGQFYKLGDSKPLSVDVRIIAATNRNLTEEIRLGHFREDLYYRISVFQIELPPLRERKEDIPALLSHYLEQFSQKSNKRILSATPDYLKTLISHDWKGNIREFKNIIERSVILADGPQLEPDSLPDSFKKHNTVNFPQPGADLNLATAEKLHIQKVLHQTNGNKTETARLLGIALTTLYRKLEEYKIS